MKDFINILIILIIFLITNLSESVAQETDQSEFQIINLKEFYNTQGAIVPESDTSPFSTPKNVKKFTPGIEEIIEAESILKNMLYMIIGYSEYYIPVLEKRIRNLYRHYVGWENEDGDKIISIIMYDFTEVNDLIKHLSDWRKRILLSLEQNKEYLDRIFYINLNNQELERGSSGLIDDYWFYGKYRGAVPHD
jgi:hypothetical protein